jgi:hypothetical protein
MAAMMTLSCILLLGCGGSAEAVADAKCQEQQNNQHMLIFIDKSSSSVLIDDHRREFLRQFQPLLKQFVSKGDRVKGYFVHENTLGAKTFIYQTYSVPCLNPQELEGESELVREGKISKYNKQVTGFAKQIQRSISDAISDTNAASTRRATDLWAALYHMDEYFAEAQQGDVKTAVFISDMAESVVGRERRNFSQRPPRDIAQAKQWAAEDLEVIKRIYQKDFSSLADVSIHVGAPIDRYEANNYEFIRVYWEHLFKQLGVASDINFEFGQSR